MSTGKEFSQGAGQPVILRLVRPSVVVLCGPAACGKSTFAARHFRPTQVISSDRARALVCDDERDQRFQTQAFAVIHFLIEQRLGINRLCVVDSTAVTAQARAEALNLAKKYKVPCLAILFDVPLESCVERDLGRERSVGRAVIERQHQLFERSRATIKQEGFDQVFELRDQDLPEVQVEILFRPVQQPASLPGTNVAQRRYPPPRPRQPSTARPEPPPQPQPTPQAPQAKTQPSVPSPGDTQGQPNSQ